MRVRLIKRKSIEGYIKANEQSRSSFRIWLTMIRYADWKAPADIQQTFASADLLGKGSNRVVFNIGGNHYRVIGKYHFGWSNVHLFIKWIGTHKEYSRLCRKNQQWDISCF